ncbi:MBL fold metallo-hydrolase [Psittacicella melopsittaci]|uniref:MBL fold metallo-hydrolase n=1 Tax=Psittacicella melopsittaci TaxID=2028576 RepID=UPI001CA6A63D|nr:MBL fold metallo-hydrolase [Psittacicella melopsittaci]
MLVILAVALFAFLKFAPVFGGKQDEQTLARMANAPTYDAQSQTFHNTQAIPLMVEAEDGEDEPRPSRIATLFNFVAENTYKENPRRPKSPLPSEKPQVAALENGQFIWLGHSTLVGKVNNQVIMTDPVFYESSPVSFFAKPFAMDHLPQTADIPHVDVVVLSHDHYDHLDYKAIKELKDRVDHFVTPLGVKAHLVRWGVEPERVTELYWWENTVINGITYTLTPNQHFTGRSFSDSNRTLWGSWVIEAPELRVFFSGDGGYGEHFKQIGERFGSFDIAFIENGQYDKQWAFIHMFPEQSLQAAKDINAQRVVPIHWAKYDLAKHKWDTPIKVYLEQHSTIYPELIVGTPVIGTTFSYDNLPNSRWWESVQ